MQTVTETVKAMPKISFGNKKLPKHTAIFNIPAVVTCPLKTELCTLKCYALKAEKRFPKVLSAREYNLKLSRSKGFTQSMIATIDKKKHKIKQFRIHESGDFYNQEYFNKWTAIAKAFPKIVFYAYTKSFHLQFNRRPGNFVLIASFDKSTDKLRMDKYKEKQGQFDNTFTIVDKGKKADCIQDCTKCSVCWTKKGKNIKVEVH